MPNPMQYQQTSLGKAWYEKPLENRIRSHGVGACVTSVGAAQTSCSWETNVTLLSAISSALALQTILKTTPPCCRQLRLLYSCKTIWKQHHFAVIRLICKSKHILKPMPPFTYYCWPRPSCCLLLCLTVSKNVLLLTKYWKYLPSAQIMSLVFCKYLQVQKKLFAVHEDSFIFGAVSTENTY